MDDGDGIARTNDGSANAVAGPGRTDGTMLIDPSSPDQSALLLRMRSRRPSSQMPPLGTVVQDQQAVAAIGRWISELVRETRRLNRVLTTTYNSPRSSPGGPVRILTACVLLLLTGIGTAAAQPAGPYLTGQVGTSAGDGGAALLTGVAIGYMSPKRLAFELENHRQPVARLRSAPVIHPRDLPATEIRVRGQDDLVSDQCGWHPDRRRQAQGGRRRRRRRRQPPPRNLLQHPHSHDRADSSADSAAPLPIDFGERTITHSETALGLNAGRNRRLRGDAPSPHRR